jgi:hypothetical protein
LFGKQEQSARINIEVSIDGGAWIILDSFDQNSFTSVWKQRSFQIRDYQADPSSDPREVIVIKFSGLTGTFEMYIDDLAVSGIGSETSLGEWGADSAEQEATPAATETPVPAEPTAAPTASPVATQIPTPISLPTPTPVATITPSPIATSTSLPTQAPAPTVTQPPVFTPTSSPITPTPMRLVSPAPGSLAVPVQEPDMLTITPHLGDFQPAIHSR